MKNQKSYTVNEAMQLMENYCAYQERCHKEVVQKLYDLKMIPEAQEKIIIHLIQHNFLNEERFAKTFARGKFSIKKWGKIKIQNELKYRNISNYNINAALNEINEEDYLKTLMQLAEKKLAVINEPNLFKKRQKLIKYLYSKGYESNLVYETVNSILN